MNKLVLNGLVVLFASAIALPQTVARAGEQSDTRVEKYQELTEVDIDADTAQAEESMELEMNEQMESEGEAVEPTTRAEETLEEAQSGNDYSANYDIRRTEAFNLVSSAYRGEFEDQGVNSYATFISNYETGELTAEDLIDAAIEAGDLSPSAMEDTSYVEAVESQLDALTQS